MSETKNNYRTLGQGIVEVNSGRKGPRIGVVCNVHGNELCGRNAVHRVLAKYSVNKGSLILIDGNQEAALLDRRFVESDMNRLFTKKMLSRKRGPQDLERAKYLAKMIPDLKLDLAIDFHSTSTETKHPFTVSFPGSEELSELCPAVRIYGWPGVVEGTLVEWMNKQNIPTVVVEAGQHVAKDSIKVAEKTLLSVLSHHGLIKLEKPIRIGKHQSFEVLFQEMVTDQKNFTMRKVYESFDAIKPGEVIAKDKKRTYRAPEEEGLYIIMPALQKNVRAGISPGAYYLMRKI